MGKRKPLSQYALDERIVERFLKYVDRRGGDECWPWLGGLDDNGYGRFGVTHGISVKAHRFALAAAGRDPGDMDALHSCNNRPCCNAAHLRPGTNADNVRDCVAAGNHINQKLSDARVDQIRLALAAGATSRELADALDLHWNTINKIRLYKLRPTTKSGSVVVVIP